MTDDKKTGNFPFWKYLPRRKYFIFQKEDMAGEETLLSMHVHVAWYVLVVKTSDWSKNFNQYSVLVLCWFAIVAHVLKNSSLISGTKLIWSYNCNTFLCHFLSVCPWFVWWCCHNTKWCNNSRGFRSECGLNEVLQQPLLGRTEENNEKHQSG